MSNYYIGAYHDKNEVSKVDLSALTKKHNITGIGAIDKYTVDYDNEQALKIGLDKTVTSALKEVEEKLSISDGDKELQSLKGKLIIAKSAIQSIQNKKLSVMYKYNKEYKKLPVIYADEKKYLDKAYLFHKILSLSSDLEFLEKLANRYDFGVANYNHQLSNVVAIRAYVREVRSLNKKPHYSEALYEALENLFQKVVIDKILNNKTGEYKEDYRSLRELALFVCRYNQAKDLEIRKAELQRKREALMGEQCTLFDDDITNNKKR